MRSTIDIPEPLYSLTKVKAEQEGVTLSAVILAALENYLGRQRRPIASRQPGEVHFDVDDLGLPRLRRAKDDNCVITEDFLNRLREQEGI